MHEKKQNVPRISTDEGMITDFSDEHFENALASIR
jgi:hypothetical protein